MSQEKCKFACLGTMLVIILILFVSGCAAIKLEPQTLNLAQESVAFMTLKASNQYKPNYQPSVEFVTVLDEERNKLKFAVDKPYNQLKNQFNEYLVIISLPAGSYDVARFEGCSMKGLFNGAFNIPLFSNFRLNQSEAVYLGHIEAMLRKRKNDDELRAGLVLPALDQLVTGFALGTFDIKISDNFKGDIAILKQKYPSLSDSSVEKRILPQWKRPTDEVISEYNRMLDEPKVKTPPQKIVISPKTQQPQPLSKKPITSTPSASTAKTCTITWTSVNIRSGPGNKYPLVTTVKQGDKLTVIGESGEWLNVRLENGQQQGWVSNRVVK